MPALWLTIGVLLREHEVSRADVVECDVCAAAENGGFSLRRAPALWIASGSVLQGQVASPHYAEPVLRRMGAQLAPGGLLLVTGYSCSFLHPALLRRVGLRVISASLATEEAGGLESDVQRFQLWVLRREGEGEAAAPSTTLLDLV